MRGGRNVRGEPRAPTPRGWVWWLPLVAVLVDVAAELIVRGREPVSFMLVAVPALAAGTRGPLGTALSTVVCLGLQLWMAGRRPGHLDEQHHIAMYIAAALIGIASVALAAQRERTRQHLIRADSVAEAMQRTLLRPGPRAGSARCTPPGSTRPGKAARSSAGTCTTCARHPSGCGPSSATSAARAWARYRRSPRCWAASGARPTSGRA
ncbi:hypothetical protein [Streptomyces sp. NPDC059010]|uniref:hypothetical protein n=1 Tax=Streptomyces sp. NPDC059010 TaxID=3346695 RepID=UPI0036AD050D